MLSYQVITDIEEFAVTNCTDGCSQMDSPIWPVLCFFFGTLILSQMLPFLFDLSLQEDRPCMCQLFRCVASLSLETKPDVADQKGRTEGDKS